MALSQRFVSSKVLVCVVPFLAFVTVNTVLHPPLWMSILVSSAVAIPILLYGYFYTSRVMHQLSQQTMRDGKRQARTQKHILSLPELKEKERAKERRNKELTVVALVIGLSLVVVPILFLSANGASLFADPHLIDRIMAALITFGVIALGLIAGVKFRQRLR